MYRLYKGANLQGKDLASTIPPRNVSRNSCLKDRNTNTLFFTQANKHEIINILGKKLYRVFNLQSRCIKLLIHEVKQSAI